MFRWIVVLFGWVLRLLRIRGPSSSSLDHPRQAAGSNALPQCRKLNCVQSSYSGYHYCKTCAMEVQCEHLELLATFPWQTTVIYTDASCIDQPQNSEAISGWFGQGHFLNFGYQLAVSFYQFTRDLQSARTLPRDQRPDLVEIIAAFMALTNLVNSGFYCCEPVALFADNENLVSSILKLRGQAQRGERLFAKGHRYPKAVRELYDLICAAPLNGRVNVFWVKSHVGIPGNEQSDALAKDARRGIQYYYHPQPSSHVYCRFDRQVFHRQGI